MLCVPLGNDISKKILADQLPFGLTAPPETENPVETLSIKKVRLGESGFPDLSTIPLPLLEVRFPDTSMKSPAVGFAVMGLNDIEVGDLTIMVLMNVKEVCSDSVPLDPLNISITDIAPSGWECGTSNEKFTYPPELEEISVDIHVSWNFAATLIPEISLSLFDDSTNLAPKEMEEPLSTIVFMRGTRSMN